MVWLQYIYYDLLYGITWSLFSVYSPIFLINTNISVTNVPIYLKTFPPPTVHRIKNIPVKNLIKNTIYMLKIAIIGRFLIYSIEKLHISSLVMIDWIPSVIWPPNVRGGPFDFWPFWFFEKKQNALGGQ